MITASSTEIPSGVADRPRLLPPPHGMHSDVPAEAYRAWDACCNSSLTTLHDRSPEHVRHELRHPEEPTPALVLGDAAHLAILQPHLFDDRYAVAGPCEGTKKSGERCTYQGSVEVNGHWYCRTHAPPAARESEGTRAVLPAAAYESCLLMSDAVRRHPAASQILGVAGGAVEVSASWTDGHTGLSCKGRIDKVCPDLSLLVDLKTTRDGSRPAFERAMFAMGYHRQAAWYLHGAAALQLPFEHFAFIAVESSPPYGVAVYRPGNDVIEAGWKQLRPLVERYAECHASGIWPGYGDEVQDISLPPWAWGQIDRALIQEAST